MTEPSDIAFEAIKAMFEMDKIKKMKQLEKLSPTKISRALGINYGRYMKKLYNPELFVIAELKKLASIINVEFRIISNVVIDEVDKKGL